MFWLGLCASGLIGAGLGVWFLTLIDGVRCRLIGIPDAREARLYPAFERRAQWWHLPWERLGSGVAGNGFAWLSLVTGTAIWTLAWSVFWLRGESVGLWIWNVLFFTGLFFVGLLDAKWRVLPVEPMLATGLAFGVARLALGGSIPSMVLGALVMGFFFGVQTYVSRGRLLGSGDPVLAIAIGLALGWPRAAVAIYATYMAVIPLLIIQAFRVGSIRRVRWPFGPLLAFGAFASWLYGAEIWRFLTGG